jgi:NADPH2:quinone reductase
VGEGVTLVQPGDRVAYAGPMGGYASDRVLPADRLVKLPDAISFETGAAMMLQGMTAQYLVRRTYPVKAGDTIVVHAAAGGVGLILTQWAHHLGATVIGVVSSEAKAELARAHGATHTVVGSAGLVAEVKKVTGGAMVPVVYDSVGKDTWAASLDCLAPLGMMVSYGNASGPVPPIDIGVLGAKGSLFLTRPTLPTYTAKRADLERVASDLFDVVSSGAVKIEVNQTFPLQDAAKAHIALEARQTTGSTVLIP